MKPRTLVFLFAILLTVTGCTGGGTKASSPTSNSGGSTSAQAGPLSGDWEGTFVAESDDDAAKAAADMMKMFEPVDLQFKPNNAYELKIMGMPMEGTYSRQGNAITLTPTLVMGKSREELEAARKESNTIRVDPEDAFKPMEGTITADGKEILLKNPAPANGQAGAAMRFRPRAEEGPRTTTVKAEEKPFVGRYSGAVELPKEQTQSMGKTEREMAEAMMRTIELRLREDNTFILSLAMRMEGKWSISGKTLTLSFTSPDTSGEAGATPSTTETQRFEVRDGGRTLVSLDKKEQGVVTFTRE
jgi:hypothetical protein